MSGVQGFTCDNLVRAELVTVTGERVVAGPDGDPELLWALRGGGGNFGVVTAFEFQAFDPGPILAGYLTYPAFAVKQVLRQAAAESPTTAPDALELTAWIGPVAARDGDVVARVGVCWPGDSADADDVLRPFRAALPDRRRHRRPDGVPRRPGDERPPAVRPAPLLEGPLPARPRRTGHRRRSSTPSRRCPAASSGLLLETIRGAARTEPEGGTAFGQRAATWNASALAIWDDPAHDDAQIVWARNAAERFGVGSLTGAGYANYAPVDETNERVRLAFGTERFTRLSQVKARYDPNNLFRFNLNVAPALIRPPQD